VRAQRRSTGKGFPDRGWDSSPSLGGNSRQLLIANVIWPPFFPVFWDWHGT
jgi:hypothetical protein